MVADIAKCKDDECPKAQHCWRFTSPPNVLEWIIEPDRVGDECEMFWPATYHPKVERVCYPPVTEKNTTKK